MIFESWARQEPLAQRLYAKPDDKKLVGIFMNYMKRLKEIVLRDDEFEPHELIYILKSMFYSVTFLDESLSDCLVDFMMYSGVLQSNICFANCRKDPFFIRTWVGNQRTNDLNTIKIS